MANKKEITITKKPKRDLNQWVDNANQFKTTSIRLDKNLLKQVKQQCLDQDVTLTEYLTRLIHRELKK